MAFENFVPAIESKFLMEERDKKLVLAKHCNSKYKGDLKKKGDRVKVLGVNSPTIYSLQKDGTYTANAIASGNIAGKGKDVIHKGIPDVEELTGYDVEFQINQMALWNYGVGDIDETLTDRDMMGAVRRKQASKIAETQDDYIARVISGFKDCHYTGESDHSRNGVYYLANSIPGTTTTGTAIGASATLNIADLLDVLLEAAKNNNISSKERFVLECSNKFHRILNKELRGMKVEVDNKTVGKVYDSYDEISICPNNSMKIGDQEYVFFRTVESTAFVDKVAKNEAYRPEKGFMDAIKGFNLYDCAITDPKAIFVVKVNY